MPWNSKTRKKLSSCVDECFEKLKKFGPGKDIAHFTKLIDNDLPRCIDNIERNSKKENTKLTVGLFRSLNRELHLVCICLECANKVNSFLFDKTTPTVTKQSELKELYLKVKNEEDKIGSYSCLITDFPYFDLYAIKLPQFKTDLNYWVEKIKRWGNSKLGDFKTRIQVAESKKSAREAK